MKINNILLILFLFLTSTNTYSKNILFCIPDGTVGFSKDELSGDYKGNVYKPHPRFSISFSEDYSLLKFKFPSEKEYHTFQCNNRKLMDNMGFECLGRDSKGFISGIFSLSDSDGRFLYNKGGLNSIPFKSNPSFSTTGICEEF